MSKHNELKVIYAYTSDEIESICNRAEGDEYYLKSEADKVIADLEESHKKEVEQLLMEIVKLKKAQRWRKFPDEKPEWGKEVLVLADDGDIRRVRFSCDYKWISWGNMRTCESSCITHWMPEPKAPEEAK